MKRFMYASIGMLCLSLAVLVGFHIGQHTAEAQASPDNIVGFSSDGGRHYVLLSDGTVWSNDAFGHGDTAKSTYLTSSRHVGNFWVFGEGE